jgi:hypothetical protein
MCICMCVMHACVSSHLVLHLQTQAGSVMRVLREQRIIWGTYADKLGHHCNAHPNNLVVSLEQVGKHGCVLFFARASVLTSSRSSEVGYEDCSRLYCTTSRSLTTNTHCWPRLILIWPTRRGCLFLCLGIARMQVIRRLPSCSPRYVSVCCAALCMFVRLCVVVFVCARVRASVCVGACV